MMRDHGGQAQHHFSNLATPAPEPHLDCSASLAPLGSPPWLEGLGHKWGELVQSYPQADALPMQNALAIAHNIYSEQVLCGNGSTELMALVLRALRPSRVVTTQPTWSGYREVCAATQTPLHLCDDSDFSNGADRPRDTVGELHILAYPNNPDGSLPCPQTQRQRALANPQTWYLVDLAFEDFLHDPAQSPWWNGDWPGNVIRIKSLTKFFCLAGLRLGFVATGADSTGVELQRKLRILSLPWQVNALAQWCGERLYTDPSWNQLQRRETQLLAQSTVRILNAAGWNAHACPAWVLATPPNDYSLDVAWKALLQKGICARQLPHTLRFGLLNPAHLSLFEERVTSLFSPSGHTVRIVQKTPPAILVAGITSDAGKSVLSAGLCAVLRSAGATPVPYKAQNMSNQAWVTPEGGEIGWSQAVQAFAAGQIPHVDMNPVLLKPSGAGRSHVIHRGVDQGAMDVHTYHASFDQHRAVALQALDALRVRGDCLVLEGAGGIAETNLRHRDLSNREAPLHVGAHTLLVGDIDRGGVFSSLYGAWSCLDSAMRAQVRGFAINRFRGDASLLDSGIRELEERTGVPVLGVLPHVGDLGLGHEDSLSLGEAPYPACNCLALGVVRLPHLSNVNDFSPLEYTAGVGLFYSDRPEKLSRAHALILPGSRNTIADLRWLKSTGIDRVIHQFHAQKKPIFAVCGGMQMLGEWVDDPTGAEGGFPTRETGLELLPLQTELRPQGKVVRPCRQSVSAKLRSCLPWLHGITEVWGYEIHCGQSQHTGRRTPGEACLDGWAGSQGALWATYWHGLLHQQRVASQWAHWIAQRAGVTMPRATHEIGTTAIPSFLQPGLTRVEELVARHLDWRRLLPHV